MSTLEDEYRRAELNLRQDDPERAFVLMKLDQSITKLSELGCFAQEKGLYDDFSDEWCVMYDVILHLSRLVIGIESGEVPPEDDYRP